MCPPFSCEFDAESSPPAPATIEDLYADLYERFVQLQTKSSGFLAFAERRLQAKREVYQEELKTLREDNRRLAQWALSLERAVEFRTRQLNELEHPLTQATGVASPLAPGGG